MEKGEKRTAVAADHEGLTIDRGKAAAAAREQAPGGAAPADKAALAEPMRVLQRECERLAAREQQLRSETERLRGALTDAGLGLEELALAADALMVAACLHFGVEQTTAAGPPRFALTLPAFDARRLTSEYQLHVERDADDYRLTAAYRAAGPAGGGGGLS